MLRKNNRGVKKKLLLAIEDYVKEKNLYFYFVYLFIYPTKII